MVTILFHSFLSFIACIALSVIFNSPKKELFYCGLAGGVSWFCYDLAIVFLDPTTATFLATLIVTILARFLSYHRQAPSTLYHIAGIMPLVPGTMVYTTMASALDSRILDTYINLFDVFKLAGAIAIGSILILVMPYSFFEFIPRMVNKNKK